MCFVLICIAKNTYLLRWWFSCLVCATALTREPGISNNSVNVVFWYRHYVVILRWCNIAFLQLHNIESQYWNIISIDMVTIWFSHIGTIIYFCVHTILNYNIDTTKKVAKKSILIQYFKQYWRNVQSLCWQDIVFLYLHDIKFQYWYNQKSG